MRTLETHHGEQEPRILRWRPAGVTPLEVWDLLIDDRLLWEFLRLPQFPEVLARALAALNAGQAMTRSVGPLPWLAGSFDGVYLAGGGAIPELAAALSGLSLPVWVSSEGTFSGERGGFQLLRERGSSGLVVDFGQSGIKISCASRRFTYPRDFSVLPPREDDSPQDLAAARKELRAYLANSLLGVRSATNIKPETIVLALPCELNDSAVPGGSSYLGMLGDRELIPDSLRAAGLNRVDTLLLNDAELAALSAASDPATNLPPRTLVLTLGFGIGAALLNKEV